MIRSEIPRIRARIRFEQDERVSHHARRFFGSVDLTEPRIRASIMQMPIADPDRFAALVDPDLYDRSGKVFYSGRAAFGAPSALYLLGLNPGGSPVQAEQTIGRNLEAWRSRRPLVRLPGRKLGRHAAVARTAWHRGSATCSREFRSTRVRCLRATWCSCARHAKLTLQPRSRSCSTNAGGFIPR